MSDQPGHFEDLPGEGNQDYGSLSVEDDPDGTVNPADLAGTASTSEAETGDEPEFSKADDDVDGPE